jgi:hypothetical protein
MAIGTAQSLGALNYSGQIFDKTNIDTPLVSMLPRRNTSSVEFVVNSAYASENASRLSISETASLTAPEPTYVTRVQETNVVQIFQYTTAVSYQKQANTGTLAGVNIAGQANNVPNEFDFQMAQKTKKARKDLELALIQSTYKKAATDKEANSTRGLIEAIKTTTKGLGNKELDYDNISEVLRKMSKAGADMNGLVIMCSAIGKAQITNNFSKLPGFYLPQSRTVGGINIDQIVTPAGTIGVMQYDNFLPEGIALIVNLGVLSIVEMPIPNKGNFFWEPLAKVGAGDKGMLYGTAGLDYGPEWYHAKITGIATTVTPLTPVTPATTVTPSTAASETLTIQK